MNDTAKPKILEKSPMSGIAVPVAIVLIGALIIFGVTKMLSTGKNYRDLVEELHSKTFGNRWVAAYELSKFIASEKIPKEDIPWLIQNLDEVYKETPDQKTKNFIVLALGSLNHPEALNTINQALKSEDKETQFNAAVSLANAPINSAIDWNEMKNLFATTQDPGLQQVLIFAFAGHQLPEGKELIGPFLSSGNKFLRYSAATALIYYKDERVLSTVEEILKLEKADEVLNEGQIESLKLNIILAAQKSQYKKLNPLIENYALSDKNIRISTRAQEALNLLKK